jgi:hypothetical protein
MFPEIHTSPSCFYILAPSYNPVMEPYTREVGSFAITGADFRLDRATTGSRAGSRMKSVAEPDHTSGDLHRALGVDRRKRLTGP